MGCCDKTVEKRTLKASDFDAKIRNDPFESLKAIEQKVCGPARSEHDHLTLVNALKKFLSIKQEDEESSTDHAKKIQAVKGQLPSSGRC